MQLTRPVARLPGQEAVQVVLDSSRTVEQEVRH